MSEQKTSAGLDIDTPAPLPFGVEVGRVVLDGPGGGLHVAVEHAVEPEPVWFRWTGIGWQRVNKNYTRAIYVAWALALRTRVAELEVRLETRNGAFVGADADRLNSGTGRARRTP